MSGLRRRALLQAAGAGVGAALLAGSVTSVYGAGVEPNWLQVTRGRVAVPRLPVAFIGTTIAQISDLHLGPYVPAGRIRVVVDTVLGLRPDLVAVTGDFVSRLDSGEAGVLARELSRLIAPLGVFAVLGNHDYWTDSEVVANALDRAGLTLLRNASARIERSGDSAFVVGVDDVWEQHAHLGRALEGVPPDATAILLAHEPDFADVAARDQRIALQLSGHSHGGQIFLPGHGPLVLPTLAQKYSRGLYRVGAMQVYTNVGVGVIRPPVRLNCRPEVTLLELVAA